MVRANHQHNVGLKDMETEQQETKSMPAPFFLMLITTVTRVTNIERSSKEFHGAWAFISEGFTIEIQIFNFKDLFILCLRLFPLHDCLPSVCSSDRDQKKVWDPLEWESQMANRCHMSARSPTRVLCKGSTCS